MYKKILVAIDDSSTSRAALQEAIQLAQSQQARLVVVHVADETLLGMHHRTLSTTLNLDHARQALMAAGGQLLAAAETEARAAGLEVEILLKESASQRIAEVIVAAAEASGADLILCGTHGRRGLQRLILGSVAEQLVRLATVSLLLVRHH